MWARSDTGSELSAEEAHAERILLVCVLLSRFFNLGIATAGTIARSKPARSKRAMLFLAAATAEAGWLAHRTWRRGSYTDRTAVWADAAFGAALLAARRAVDAPTTDADDELAWLFQYSLASTAAAAMGLGPTPEGALATAALAAGHHAGKAGGRTSDGEWIAYPGTLLAVGFMGREMRRSARALGTSRRVALEVAREQGTARERVRQHRLLHDSALQTLEAAVTHWDELGEAIRARASIEADQLRAAQVGDVADTADLATLLDRLATQFDALGVEVVVTSRHDPDDGAPGPETTAVADAVHEALVNVRKHAGVRTAAVETTSVGDGLLVIVHDEGVGFDPRRTRAKRRGGFGIHGSIHARLAEVGGQAEILSRPGSGTRVIIRTGGAARSNSRSTVRIRR